MGSVEHAFAEGGRKAKLANQNVRNESLELFWGEDFRKLALQWL
jgi:hypothetical protein